MKKFDLEERLIDFSSLIIYITESLPNSRLGSHLAGQMIRSGTSVSLNYGEAQSAESRKDFIHKIKVVLKELRETLVCLKLIRKRALIRTEKLDKAIQENNELISIFVASVKTTMKNDSKK